MNIETLKTLITDEELQEITKNSTFEGTPLWEHWGKFVENYIREGRSTVTLKNVRDKLRFAIKNLGFLTIEELNDPALLQEKLFVIAEQRNWSGSTINSNAKDVKTYFIWLEDMGILKENRLKKFRKCKEMANEQRTLTDEEVKTLQNLTLTRRQSQVERWRNILFIDLSILTGARPCELADLEVRDITSTQNGYELKIQGHKQKGKVRRYRLPSSIRDTFEMYMHQRNRIERKETHLFISMSGSKGWGKKGMLGLMKRLSKELGFSVSSYAIRRYVATKLYKEEVPIKDIMAHLGHTRLATTLRYIENGSHMTDRGVNVMSRVI